MTTNDPVPDPIVALAVMGALDDLPIGVSILAFPRDPASARPPRRVYANRALADLFGYTLEEIYALPARLPVADDELPRLAHLFQAWMNGERPGTLDVIDTAIRTRDGVRIPIEARIGRGTLGDDRLILAFVSDISARVRAAEALRTSEELFRRLAEGAPDAIVISVDGVIAYANHETARMLGYEPSDLVGLSLATILEPDEVAPMIERMRRRHGGQNIGPREYRAHRKDGSPITVEISASAIMFQGRPALLAVGRDVEERVRRQAEVIRADRMAAVGALAAGVAHEVNNPLTYVILQLDRLRARLGRSLVDPRDREACEAMLADALDGSQRVAQIVRDLLWFAREDNGGRVPIDVREAIDTAVKLATSALRHRATLVRDVGEVPAVAGNAARLTQVFLNLVVNAAQSFPRDAPDDNHVWIDVRTRGDRVVIDISDDGPGIPDALARRVFEPFFTTKPGGTGLGLSISRSIVEDGGGAIELLPRPGGGTLMRVSLPAWVGDGGRAATPVAVSAAPQSRILVVDDDAILARAVAAALGERHQVGVASTGQVALDRIDLDDHAVVVCDLAMPGMSGVELARRVVAERPAYHGRFLFITGGAVPQELAAQIEELGGAIVAKPFDLAELDAAIAARLAATGR
jgi:PAS domain S-box-containing protein